MIYRAQYQTKSGTVRRMTFAHAGGIKAAHAFATEWQLADDRLVSVATVREIARPAFSLQANLSGV